MARKPSVAIVGPGRLGTVLAQALTAAGFPVTEIRARNARAARALARKVGARAAGMRDQVGADIAWICVPDGEIRAVARKLAAAGNWEGKIALHPSGALAAAELQPLQQRGAAAASCHPMMSFTRGVQPNLTGVPFAIEGDARAVRAAAAMARALGGTPLRIAAAAKPLYHAFGAFASPLLIALLAAGERVGRAASLPAPSLRRALAPILRQTVENYVEDGAAAAFSGPLVRGDTATVRRHLQVLRKYPEARAVYVALARSALRTLPVHNKRDIARLLSSR